MTKNTRAVARSVVALVGVATMLTACAGSGGSASGGASQTLQDAHHNEPTTWLGESDQEWAKDINELTDGQIDVQFHWANSLASAADSVEALGSGTSQIGLVFPVYAPGGFEVDPWIADVAFLSSQEPIIGDMQAWAASLEWSLNTPEKIEEFRDKGVEPLLPHFETNANYFLACNEPVTSVDEAKGKSVRVAGSALSKEAEALGMSTSTMPPTEIFEALQRGVIDCSINPFRDMVDFGLLDVVTDITTDTEVGFSGFNMALGVNKDWWDSQTTEVKQGIWKSLRNYPGRQLKAAIGQDLIVPTEAKKRGLTFHEMQPDMKEALRSNQEERLAAAAKNGPEALGDHSEESLQAFQDSMDKWYAIIHDELGYGEQIPDTWAEVAEQGITADDIDFDAFSERVWEEILEPHMPK